MSSIIRGIAIASLSALLVAGCGGTVETKDKAMAEPKLSLDDTCARIIYGGMDSVLRRSSSYFVALTEGRSRYVPGSNDYNRLIGELDYLRDSGANEVQPNLKIIRRDIESAWFKRPTDSRELGFALDGLVRACR